jgi:hypothetical protein
MPLDVKAGTKNDGCGCVSGGGRKLVLLIFAFTTSQSKIGQVGFHVLHRQAGNTSLEFESPGGWVGKIRSIGTSDRIFMACHTLCDCMSFEATTSMEILRIRKCCRRKQLCRTLTKRKVVLLLPTTKVLSRMLDWQLRWEARNPMVGRRDDPRTDLVTYCCKVDTCAYVPLRSGTSCIRKALRAENEEMSH